MQTSLMALGRLRHLSTLSRLVSRTKKTTTSNTDTVNKLFELRTYNVKPKHFQSFVKLTNQYLHLRTTHSKLVGYWTAELGSLNQTIHIWEYDDLEHRAKVRKDLAADITWHEKYLSKMLPMIDRQDNMTMSLLPCCFIEIPDRLGVYELMRFTSAGGSRSVHEDYEEFITASKKIFAEQSSSLIGCFETEYGPNNTMLCVWQHESFDAATIAKRELWRDPDILGLPFTRRLRRLYSVGMVPLPISPLQ